MARSESFFRSSIWHNLSSRCSRTTTFNWVRFHLFPVKIFIRSFTGHRQEVVGLQWNADEKFLASGSGDTTVRLWDAALCGENSSVCLRKVIYNQVIETYL